jgi:hypothetical protein
MRGHLQQRGRDSWRLKVFVGRSSDGKRRYIERTVRGSRRDAERALARLVVEADEGRHAAAAPMTFGELLDRWLAVKKLAVEPTTLRPTVSTSRTAPRSTSIPNSRLRMLFRTDRISTGRAGSPCSC